jgi:hypothetical protein
LVMRAAVTAHVIGGSRRSRVAGTCTGDRPADG